MTTDYRALCAELATELEAWEKADDQFSEGGTIRADANYGLAPRARAALAQSEPEALTLDCDEIDVPVWHFGNAFYVYKEGYTAGWAEGVRAATAHCARPAIEPVPEGPTDEELRDLWSWAGEQDQGPHPTQQHCFARAVLARWGHPTPTPIPVSEGLPGAEDCAPWPEEPDCDPWCWAAKDIDGGWEWTQLSIGHFSWRFRKPSAPFPTTTDNP